MIVLNSAQDRKNRSPTYQIASGPKLYELHQHYAGIIQLNHRFWLDHHKHLEYRSTLLEDPKAERLEVFRQDFQSVIPLITRKELAQYLNLSEEYLRRLF